MSSYKSQTSPNRQAAFSLIEVVLAIGIFLVTILALVGLLGPTLKSVDDVDKTEEVVSVVNTLNAFLQNSPDIAPGGSKFNAIFNAVADGNVATIFVYRWYDDSVPNDLTVRLEVGFADNENGSIDTLGVVNSDRVGAPQADFTNAAGPIYRVVLTPSSVIPETGTDFDGNQVTYRSAQRNAGTQTYTLSTTLGNYAEGYFAMEARIFSREQDQLVLQGATMPTPTLADLANEEPIFTYNTAIVR